MNEVDILNLLKNIPIPTYTLPQINVTVTNGMSEESHMLVNEDSVAELMFDLSMYGGVITDLSYDVRLHREIGISVSVDIKIFKTMMSEYTNITADIMEQIAKIVRRKR